MYQFIYVFIYLDLCMYLSISMYVSIYIYVCIYLDLCMYLSISIWLRFCIVYRPIREYIKIISNIFNENPGWHTSTYICIDILLKFQYFLPGGDYIFFCCGLIFTCCIHSFILSPFILSYWFWQGRCVQVFKSFFFIILVLHI